jgi:hypothetical protein
MKCVYYECSRSQREAELERGEGLHGTQGYESMGCFSCDGHKENCKSYTPIEDTAENHGKLQLGGKNGKKD